MVKGLLYKDPATKRDIQHHVQERVVSGFSILGCYTQDYPRTRAGTGRGQRITVLRPKHNGVSKTTCREAGGQRVTVLKLLRNGLSKNTCRREWSRGLLFLDFYITEYPRNPCRIKSGQGVGDLTDYPRPRAGLSGCGLLSTSDL